MPSAKEKLALYGGAPVSRDLVQMEHGGIMEEEEIEAAGGVLRSGRRWQYNGEHIAAFEAETAAYLGARHAIAVNTGTTNMHIALAACGIGPGDEVITTPFTFIATQVAILLQNAVPIFADIDPTTYNISPGSVEAQITERTKAILAVSLFGNPLDMDPLMQIARRHNLKVIDDAAQSEGAVYHGRKIGALADITCFSFTAPKPMTTAGEGGMITTDDDDLAHSMGMIRAFGYDRVKRLHSNQLIHEMIGWNARLTEIQAAVGRAQLRKLDRWNQIRIDNAHYLTARLSQIDGIIPPAEQPDTRHIFWMYTIRLLPKRLGVSRDQFQAALRAEGIESHVYYAPPNYRQPYFQELRGYGNTSCPWRCPWYTGHVDYTQVRLPVVEQVAGEVLSLPVQNLLGLDDMEKVATAVEKVAGVYRR
jgi:perosamine synthetase